MLYQSEGAQASITKRLSGSASKAYYLWRFHFNDDIIPGVFSNKLTLPS